MPKHSDLPHLIRLLDDDTPVVRDAVRRALQTFGADLDNELRTLSLPITEAERALVFDLLASAVDLDELGPVTGEQLFRVGQLVRHVRYGYRGVVVSCDAECRADDRWYLANRYQPERAQAWYHVLVHEGNQVTYAAESSLESDPHPLPIEHPLVRLFFSGFDNGRYLRNDRPWPQAAL
jgi:heat shock protein HspQ